MVTRTTGRAGQQQALPAGGASCAGSGTAALPGGVYRNIVSMTASSLRMAWLAQSALSPVAGPFGPDLPGLDDQALAALTVPDATPLRYDPGGPGCLAGSPAGLAGPVIG